MKRWLIRQCYGHGSGRVCIGADLPRVADAGFWREAWSDGSRIQVRPVPVLASALSLALLLALFQVLQPHNNDVAIELVPFQTAKLEPRHEPLKKPEPIPEPEPPKREPEPRPKPVVQPAPPKQKPKPQIDSVAEVRPPAPVPEPPPVAPEPEPVTPPRRAPVVQIDSLVAEAPTATTPTFDRKRPQRSPAPPTPAPPLAADPLQSETQPKIASRPVVRPKPLQKPARHTSPVPSLVPAASDYEELNLAPSAPVRVVRSQPQKRSETRSRPGRLVAPAGVPSTTRQTPKPSVTPRTQRPAAPVTTPKNSRSFDAPKGVPLGSLAACVSDREEDRLKQKLLATVTTQEECVSSAGRYRFVETRNLNAFLMWVERAPSRAEADRCQELRHAIACVKD